MPVTSRKSHSCGSGPSRHCRRYRSRSSCKSEPESAAGGGALTAISAADAGAAMPTNATRPTVASRKLFIFSSPFPLASIFVPANGVAGVALIPTCNVNPRYVRRKAPCQNGNTQELSVNVAGGRLPRPPMRSVIALLIIGHMAGAMPVHRESHACLAFLHVRNLPIFPDCASGFSAASPLSCSCPSSSHDGMLPDAIARLGK